MATVRDVKAGRRYFIPELRKELTATSDAAQCKQKEESDLWCFSVTEGPPVHLEPDAEVSEVSS